MKSFTFPKTTIHAFEGDKEVPNSFEFLNPEWNIEQFLIREGDTTPLTRIVVARDTTRTVFERVQKVWVSYSQGV